MFTEKESEQILRRGMTIGTACQQLERFKNGFPWLRIVAPATPARGIQTLDGAGLEEAVSYADNAEVDGKCKFVPASGAASRMFKDIFAGLETLRSGEDTAPDAAVSKLAASIRKFAFWSGDIFPEEEDSPAFRQEVAEKVLESGGLGYGSKPKGVIRFHRYEDGEVRTALAEHLVEGQEYMRNPDGTVMLTFTISPEHKELFVAALEEVKATYETRYNVRFDIRFTYQDKSTDTIAVTPDNVPFLKEDGSILFRPAGHGALIRNLSAVEEELVSIKNIDNVACERLLPLTALYKKALMGKCLMLRDMIRDFMKQAEAVSDTSSDSCIQLCDRIEAFLDKELCISVPAIADAGARFQLLKEKLDRPVRVCGMVRNLGEAGGGPFIIADKDGCTSLQILESTQINKSDSGSAAALAASTHFNPVDIVCCLRDWKGRKYDLEKYVDPDTGFISSKSYQGRELKALELPGLWNGSMSGWNTCFVEVPVETFNPVKVVLDLLREAHQA